MLMLLYLAVNPHYALPLIHTTVAAHFFNRCPYFHRTNLNFMYNRYFLFLERNVIRPLVKS